MDTSIEIMQLHIKIEEFILVWTSKRGGAAWLAALEDKRVYAIIPLIIDILNVEKNIAHICNSYIQECPLALKDYEEVLDAIRAGNAT